MKNSFNLMNTAGKMSKLLAMFYVVSLSTLVLPWMTFAQSSNVVPGQIMVKFDYDEIELPGGLTEADFGQASIRSEIVRQALQRFSVNRIARVVPTAVKGDTLRILPNGTRLKLTDFFDLYLLKFPSSISVDSVLLALQPLGPIIYAEPDQFVVTDAQPNDQLYSSQWHLKQASGEDIDAEPAWDLSKGDNIKIAIIDDGVRISHEDLDGKIQGGETTASGSHGTLVAGAAAAETNNTVGVASVGWNAKIIPYNSGGLLSGAVSDINSAVSAGAHIINMSWLVPSYNQSFKDALDNAAAQAVTLIASAGNFDYTVPFVAYPHAFDGLVTSVSATNSDGDFRDGWNYGYFVDVAAPGVEIWTTDGDNDQDYTSASGTSLSAPIVSGIVALLKAYDSGLLDRDFERIVELSADTVDFTQYPYGSDKWNDRLGHGRVNAHKALLLVNSNEAHHWSTSSGSVHSSTYGGWWMYDLSGAPNGYYVGHRREVRKAITFPQAFSAPPQVWGRIAGTVGYNSSHSGTCYSIPHCEVVPGTVTNTGATLRTYVYEIARTDGSYSGWYPTTAANVAFAYTAFGYYVAPSVTITGPTMLEWKAWGTWTANPSGGNGAYTYEWRFREAGEPNWSGVAGTSQQYTRQMLPVDMELQVKVTSDGQIVYDTHYVEEGFNKASAPVAEESSALPEVFFLSQNYPNPFNRSAQSPQQNLATSIRLGLPEATQVQLVIFDLMGREVRRLVDRPMTAGYHEMIWDGKDQAGHLAPAGVYFYHLIAGEFREWKKLAVVR